MGRPLFNKTDIFTVCEYQKNQFKQAFQQVSNAELDRDTQGVVAHLVEQFGIDVPVLHDDQKHAEVRETQVDVSRDPTRFITDRSKPFYINGTELTYVIPFSGDAALFDVQPSSFNLSPPFGEVHNKELRLNYTVTNAQFNVEAEAERNISQIKQYLNNMRPSGEQLKRELEALGASLIQRRNHERGTHLQILAGLKTPIRQAPPLSVAAPAPVYPPARRRASKKKQQDEWDVFISHATEDKAEIARPLADALKAAGVRVWYDDFALTLGDSLRQSIDRGLAKSLFGVVILSPHFFEKHWPQQELNGLATREVEGEKVILPVWHNIGAEGVRNNSPMLADRKAVSTSEGVPVVVQKIMQVVRPE
jgi:curved DNA-binding protein CbpA